MGVLLDKQQFKFNVDPKNGKKMQRNINGFSDNLI